MAAVDGLDFDPDEVREGLWLAMEVGLPVELEEQPVFVFPADTLDTGVERDSQGVPFDWQAGRTKVGEDVTFQVPCAIEYKDEEGQTVNFGVVAPARVELTLLDHDYELIKGFSYVIIAGNRYRYLRTQPPIGLVDVGVYIIHCRTDDEG